MSQSVQAGGPLSDHGHPALLLSISLSISHSLHSLACDRSELKPALFLSHSFSPTLSLSLSVPLVEDPLTSHGSVSQPTCVYFSLRESRRAPLLSLS